MLKWFIFTFSEYIVIYANSFSFQIKSYRIYIYIYIHIYAYIYRYIHVSYTCIYMYIYSYIYIDKFWHHCMFQRCAGSSNAEWFVWRLKVIPFESNLSEFWKVISKSMDKSYKSTHCYTILYPKILIYLLN